MVRAVVIVSVVAMIGLVYYPAHPSQLGCGGADSPSSGLNGPCTRAKDCGGSLDCIGGVCAVRDSGVGFDSGLDATATEDGGDDGG